MLGLSFETSLFLILGILWLLSLLKNKLLTSKLIKTITERDKLKENINKSNETLQNVYKLKERLRDKRKNDDLKDRTQLESTDIHE